MVRKKKKVIKKPVGKNKQSGRPGKNSGYAEQQPVKPFSKKKTAF